MEGIFETGVQGKEPYVVGTETCGMGGEHSLGQGLVDLEGCPYPEFMTHMEHSRWGTGQQSHHEDLELDWKEENVQINN